MNPLICQETQTNNLLCSLFALPKKTLLKKEKKKEEKVIFEYEKK
jgi:hypothetical protein